MHSEHDMNTTNVCRAELPVPSGVIACAATVRVQLALHSGQDRQRGFAGSTERLLTPHLTLFKPIAPGNSLDIIFKILNT